MVTKYGSGYRKPLPSQIIFSKLTDTPTKNPLKKQSDLPRKQMQYLKKL